MHLPCWRALGAEDRLQLPFSNMGLWFHQQSAFHLARSRALGILRVAAQNGRDQQHDHSGESVANSASVFVHSCHA